jgi:hypothetical protein
MLFKYLVTLVATVVVATLVVASLDCVTASEVLSGQAVSESLQFAFTIDAGGGQYRAIDADLAQFLATHVSFPTQGPPHVVAAKVQVTPQQVSWNDHFANPLTNMTAPGAAMSVQLEWNTAGDSANGSSGSIYLNFPEIPGLEGKTVTIRSGPNQVDSAGRSVIRQVTTYRSAAMVAMARFILALAIGLPFGIILHTVFLGLPLVSREKRAFLSALPPQDAGLPRTFYPDPGTEWFVWLPILGASAFAGSIFACSCLSNGLITSGLALGVAIGLPITVAIALPSSYLIGKKVLSVRVESEGIAYARGRGNPQWTSAPWDQVAAITPKSNTYRGHTTNWIEIMFYELDTIKIIDERITDFAGLRNLLASVAKDKMRVDRG